jgi:hypothetical protein
VFALMFFSQRWIDTVQEALWFKFYVKHDMMDKVKKVTDSKQ